jgi:ATP-dependent Clp protease ATP-binding subunit ClpC
MNDISAKFTEHVKNSLTRAYTFALEQKQVKLEAVFLLWSIATERGSIACDLLQKAGLDAEIIKEECIGGKRKKESGELIEFSPMLRSIIEHAALVASKHGHSFIGTEHLLAGILHLEDPKIKKVFENAQLEKKDLEESLKTVLQADSHFSDAKKSLDLPPQATSENTSESEEDSTEDSALNYFTRELTSEEIAQDLDNVAFREAEIDRLMIILARRQKNNPLLIGEPGVGKSALIEGLAKKISEGKAHPSLAKMKIYEVDLASMIAGTMYRGEFEERIKQLIDEATNNPNVVLFIDEIHNLMGAGSNSGSLDAANILKPALARGTIRCIGATTPSEFKKFMENDGALTRRFQLLRLDEPDKEQTKKMLKATKDSFEQHHGVYFSNEVIDALVDFAAEYIPNRHFPDKAVDILDETSARVKLDRGQEKSQNKKKVDIEKELEAIEKHKKQAVNEERFKDASRLKRKEAQLKKKLAELSETSQEELIPVEISDVEKVLAQVYQVRLATRTPRSFFKELNTRIAGQENAMKQIAEALLHMQLRLKRRNTPLASLLFVGPSGVGKTMTAEYIAELQHGHRNHLLRLDMSEFTAPHMVSKLIGAPAGYIGYKESSLLTDFVKQHPQAIIVFDEIDKAHPQVRQLLLQILEGAKLSDSSGSMADFRETIIIMTANGDIESDSAIGFGRETEAKKANIKHFLTPSIISRIDKVIHFEGLNERSLKSLVEARLSEMIKTCANIGIKLEVTSAAKKQVSDSISDAKNARDALRKIEDILSKNIINLALNKNKQHIKVVKGKERVQIK